MKEYERVWIHVCHWCKKNKYVDWKIKYLYHFVSSITLKMWSRDPSNSTTPCASASWELHLVASWSIALASKIMAWQPWHGSYGSYDSYELVRWEPGSCLADGIVRFDVEGRRLAVAVFGKWRTCGRVVTAAERHWSMNRNSMKFNESIPTWVQNWSRDIKRYQESK